MKIAITGSTSSLAHYLVPFLSKKHEVITMGRGNSSYSFNLLNKLDSLIIPEKTDVLINTAAAFNSSTDEEILETEEVNALGTLKLCIAAKRAGVRHFIQISSQAAMFDHKSPYYGIYSISKKHSEELANHFCARYDMPLTILRPSQPYDISGLFRKHQPLFYQIIDKAQFGEDIELFGQNDAVRNYIFIDDFLEIIERVIVNKIKGAYYCNALKNYKLSQIATIAQNAFNLGGNISFIKGKSDIPNNVFKTDLNLYHKIGFFPMIDLYEGIFKISEHRKRLKK